jgi:hypothetical protein
MRWVCSLPSVAAGVALVTFSAGRAEAQVRYGAVVGYPYSAPYGYQITNGQLGPGYLAAYGLHQRAYLTAVPRVPQTVTDYRPLISAITSIPGWYGPPAHTQVYHPERPQPTVPRDELLADDGTVRWPSAAPYDPTRRAAEDAVREVVQEHRRYGQATVRRVADARNKLTAYARQVLPAVKARNPADAAGLERFIVELQKTLATLAVNY